METRQISHDGKLWAVVIRGGKVAPGVHFVTTEDNALQVGKQLRARGTLIAPHAHCAVAAKKQDGFLQEVLHIERGKLKTVFYADDGTVVDECILEAGDTILLIQGGHGFEILEDTQMLEIKMGPYDPASKKNINIKEIPPLAG